MSERTDMARLHEWMLGVLEEQKEKLEESVSRKDWQYAATIERQTWAYEDVAELIDASMRGILPAILDGKLSVVRDPGKKP
jgi:hypothetical protein